MDNQLLNGLFDAFDSAGGISAHDGSGLDIAGHNRAGGDYAVVTYGYSGHQCGASSDPDIVADGDGFRPFHHRISLGWIQRMACRIDRHIRSDEAIVADCHQSLVKDGEIEICEEIFSYMDIAAVIAMKRLIDTDLLSAAAEQIAENRFQFRRIGIKVVIAL